MTAPITLTPDPDWVVAREAARMAAMSRAHADKCSECDDLAYKLHCAETEIRRLQAALEKAGVKP